MQLKLSSSTTLRPLCDTTIECRSVPHRDQRMFLENHGQIQQCEVQILVFAFESYIRKIGLCICVSQKINYLFICFYLPGFPGNARTPGACRGKGPLRNCWTYSKTRHSSQIYARLSFIFVHKSAKQMWLTDMVSQDVSSWNKSGN